MARHVHITQNNKFAISLQHFKKEVSDAVDFLHADKYESLLQIDTMILMGIVKYSQSFQNTQFAMSLQCLKKDVRDEIDIQHADKNQIFLQVDFSTLGIKNFYILKVLKVTSL